MADYCRQCSLRIHGHDHRDLARLCEPGETVWELCEGCGEEVEIDHIGMRVGRNQHGSIVNGACEIIPARDLSRWQRLTRRFRKAQD